MPDGLVLLSGGLDSVTVLARAVADGFAVRTLSFSYGQAHTAELVRARELSARHGALDHFEIALDPRPFRASALTGRGGIPEDRSGHEMAAGIAPTYVPARNTIFLSYALAFGEELGIRHIFIGVNSVDYSGYPDCRPEFIAAFARLANLGTSAADGGDPFIIHAPLQNMGKAEIISMGMALGVDYSLTVSCYQADAAGLACGRCDACLLRREGFRQAGVADPTRYR